MAGRDDGGVDNGFTQLTGAGRYGSRLVVEDAGDDDSHNRRWLAGTAELWSRLEVRTTDGRRPGAMELWLGIRLLFRSVLRQQVRDGGLPPTSNGAGDEDSHN